MKKKLPANTNDGISMPAAGKADIGIYYFADEAEFINFPANTNDAMQGGRQIRFTICRTQSRRRRRMFRLFLSVQ